MVRGYYLAIACFIAVKVNGQTTLDMVLASVQANGVSIRNIQDTELANIANQLTTIDTLVKSIQSAINVLVAIDKEISNKLDGLSTTASDTNRKSKEIEGSISEINGNVDSISSTLNSINNKAEEVKKTTGNINSQTDTLRIASEDIEKYVKEIEEKARGIASSMQGTVTDKNGKQDRLLEAINKLNQVVLTINERIGNLKPNSKYRDTLKSKTV